jgi:hypothetical protein
MTGFSCPGENSETEDEKEQRRQRELIAKHRQSTGTEEAPDGFYADNGGENGSRSSVMLAAPDPHHMRGGRTSVARRATGWARRSFVNNTEHVRTLTDKIKEGVEKVSKPSGVAVGHLRAHDIVHVNTGAYLLEAGHHFMYGPPVLVLLFALVVYVACAVFFAFVFWTFGADCYKLENNEFTFAAMLWISTHVFSVRATRMPCCALVRPVSPATLTAMHTRLH